MIISLGIQANNLSIIPYPNSVVAHPGTYQFDVCHLSFDKALKNEAMYLESMLKEDFGLSSITVKREQIFAYFFLRNSRMPKPTNYR